MVEINTLQEAGKYINKNNPMEIWYYDFPKDAPEKIERYFNTKTCCTNFNLKEVCVEYDEEDAIVISDISYHKILMIEVNPIMEELYSSGDLRNEFLLLGLDNDKIEILFRDPNKINK